MLPIDFLETLLFKEFQGNRQSLSDHVLQLAVDHNIHIRKQSLDERFTEASCKFVQGVLFDKFKSLGDVADLPDLEAFPAVYLQDSTKFKLPNSMHADYPGYHQSGASIQLTLDIKRHSINRLSIHPQTHSDSREACKIDGLQQGSLLIRDLGYFSVEGLKAIESNNSFFISRLQPRSALYEIIGDTHVRFNLKDLLVKMKKRRLVSFEKILYINNQSRHQVRVCFFLLPEKIRNERLRKQRLTNKNRGWKSSKEYDVWTWFNVFITNASVTQMSISQIEKVYKYRWQIELVFKSWKSYYQIEKLKAMKKERIECYLFSILLKAIIHNDVMNIYKAHITKKDTDAVSFLKFTKLLVGLDKSVKRIMTGRRKDVNEFIKLLERIGSSAVFKESKKSIFVTASKCSPAY